MAGNYNKELAQCFQLKKLSFYYFKCKIKLTKVGLYLSHEYEGTCFTMYYALNKLTNLICT